MGTATDLWKTFCSFLFKIGEIRRVWHPGTPLILSRALQSIKSGFSAGNLSGTNSKYLPELFKSLNQIPYLPNCFKAGDPAIVGDRDPETDPDPDPDPGEKNRYTFL